MTTMQGRSAGDRVSAPTSNAIVAAAAASTLKRPGAPQTPRAENDPRTRLYVDG
jgi:hypothetical protein